MSRRGPRGSGAVTPKALSLETALGALLLGCSVVAAALVARHPGPSGLDRWGFAMATPALHPSLHRSLLRTVTDIGNPAVVAGCSIVAAAVALRSDRFRATACLIGPPLAVVLAEYVTKPLVGRYFIGVLSYPSGTVTAISAAACALAVAAPPRLRPGAAAGALVLTALGTYAVLGLRWHYLSDALAGAAMAAGTVMLVDGLLRPAGRRLRLSFGG